MCLFAALSLPAWGQAAAKEKPALVCAQCHQAQAKTQPDTPMGHALETVADCDILRAHPKLTFREGAYSFEIVRKGDQSIYTVTDGSQTITVPIGWAFGLGSAGQTYVFERDGYFYESRVSYFEAVNGLDLTMGAANIHPKTIDEAAGRKMEGVAARECFACHATNAVDKNRMTLDRMEAGVRCERCHVGAEQHAAAIKAGDAKAAMAIPRLSKLDTEEMSNFCGQCHRTWETIALDGPKGVLNVRFQPYRLTDSKCYDAADPRIKCVACHDPHQNVVSNAAYYDSKCLACHAAGAHTPALKACPVAKANCVTCHMPLVDLPGAHKKFTDHQIRIVRANEPYPN